MTRDEAIAAIHGPNAVQSPMSWVDWWATHDSDQGCEVTRLFIDKYTIFRCQTHDSVMGVE